jgi:hypothetical protein
MREVTSNPSGSHRTTGDLATRIQLFGIEPAHSHAR